MKKKIELRKELIQQLIDKYNLKIELRDTYLNKEETYRYVNFSIDNSIIPLFVNDPEKKLTNNNIIDCFYLIIKELEIYKITTDFNDWKVRKRIAVRPMIAKEYYNSLCYSYNKITHILGVPKTVLSTIEKRIL